MRSFVHCCFLTIGLLSASLAPAQYGPPNGPYRPDSVTALVEKVHRDLNRGYDVWRLGHRERDRLNHAEHELREFEQHWRRGRFDKGNLDDAIGAIQHVLDKNRLTGRERDALWEDTNQLRRMREAYDRHEIGRW